MYIFIAKLVECLSAYMQYIILYLHIHQILVMYLVLYLMHILSICRFVLRNAFVCIHPIALQIIYTYIMLRNQKKSYSHTYVIIPYFRISWILIIVLYIWHFMYLHFFFIFIIYILMYTSRLFLSSVYYCFFHLFYVVSY